MRPYDENVTGSLRSHWNAPGAVPPPPKRVWRDWALLAAVVLLAGFEGLVRSVSSPWTLIAMGILLAVSPTVLWRRTHPLLMLAIAFVPLGVVGVLVGDSNELITSALLLVLPYAVFRWGSGRAVIVGTALMLVDLAVTVLGAGDFSAAVGLLVVMAPILTLAVALRYRASARVRELDRAKLLEREQLARDLHDTVAHHVSAIAIRAQAGLATAQNPEAAADALGVIEAEASKTLAEMRSMVRVLRRDGAAELAPGRRIDDIAALATMERGGITVDVQVAGDTESVPPTVAAAIYRLARESVTNARRHARNATRIDVRVNADDAGVQLSVHDDGDTGPATTPGYGITGMTERAALLGGTLRAGRAAERGWVVDAVLPRAGWGA